MRVDYSRTFKKDFKKLSEKLKIQLGIRIKIFKINPLNPVLNNHRVHYPYEGCQSINITGDIRALYETSGDLVVFVRVGSHNELYK
jgi:mRNA interferase YafQ